MTLGVALGSPNTSDIFEKRPIELGVQNVHSWPSPGHPGINRPAWHLLTRSVFRSRMQRISRRSCDHSPLESLSLDLRHGQRSLPSHTQISVVRVPLGASTAIARRAKCLGHAHAEAALVDGSCPTCEALPIGTLRSRLGFFAKRPRVTAAACRSGPSTSGYEVHCHSNVHRGRAWGRGISFAESIPASFLFFPGFVPTCRVSGWVWEPIPGWAQSLIRGSEAGQAVNCSIRGRAWANRSRWLGWASTYVCWASVRGWRWDSSRACPGS